LYADGGRQGASSAVQITDRYHLVSNLSEAVEHDVQQLQIDARKQLARREAQRLGVTNKLTLIEARRLEMSASAPPTVHEGAWIRAVDFLTDAEKKAAGRQAR
jgi:hypothetical protein